MPSFRIVLGIGALRPGAAPPSLLPAAADAVASAATVEATSVELVAGEPRIVVRFSVDDVELARQVGAHATAVLARDAELLSARLLRRDGGRWTPLGDPRRAQRS